MQTLSAIFVSVVTAASSILPNANLSKVLGEETVMTDASPAATATSSLLENARMKREEFTQRVKEKRQEVKNKVASREAEIKNKISQIKDERKQKIVENLNQRFDNLNSKWVTHWNNVLTRLTEILAKIEDRGNKLALEGKDITSLTNAIVSAKTSIANAQGAVDAQSGKTYEVNVTDEDSLRTDAQSAVAQFKSDIKTTRTLIQAARESVRNTFVELGKISGENVSVESEAGQN